MGRRLGANVEALRAPRFAWYFTARTVSQMGSAMAPVAVAFAVLHVDGRASAVGQVVGIRVVATVVFLLVGGVVADRLPRTVILQSAHLLTCVSQAVAAYLVVTGHATLGSLTAIEAINGAVSAFTMPAMAGIVPQVVPRPLLQQANALLSLSRSTAQIVGPALAGIVVAGAGPGWALAADSMTYAVAAVALSRVRLPSGRVERASSMVVELRQGWSAFRNLTWAWTIVLAFSVLNAISVGSIYVLGPTLASRTPSIGSAGWGVLLAVEAVGTVLATMVLLTHRVGRPLLFGMIAVSAIAAPIAGLGLRWPLWLIAAAFLLAGIGTAVFGVGWETALQENVSPDALSRVSSYDSLGSYIAIPVGTFAYGWMAGVMDPYRLLVISAIAYLVLACGTLGIRSVRNLRSSPGEDAAVALETSATSGP